MAITGAGFAASHVVTGGIHNAVPGANKAIVDTAVGGANWLAGKLGELPLKDRLKASADKASDKAYPKSHYPTLRNERAGKDQYFNSKGERLTLKKDPAELWKSAQRIRALSQEIEKDFDTMSHSEKNKKVEQLKRLRREQESLIRENNKNN